MKMMITKLLFATLGMLSLDVAYGMRRVCYYTNWAQYRPDFGKFIPENMDPELCTHIVFAFAQLQNNKLTTYEWNDDGEPWRPGMYKRFNDIKMENGKIKTLLAVGGWNMGSPPFTSMVATNESRKEFAMSTVQFLRERNFDGLDLDWEYPTKRGSPLIDRYRYRLLVQTLRETFDREVAGTKKKPLLLTSAVAAGKEYVDDGYETITMARDMDFISVMTYDLHGAWENTTGHNSPLFARAGEHGKQRFLNMDWAMKYWHSKGVPKQKLNVGLALYGRTFRLANGDQNYVGAPAVDKGNAGKYTREAGFLSYYEICNIANASQRYYIEDQRVPYLVEKDQWIGYDDPQSLALKVKYFKDQNYGGVMVWSLDLDDFSGQCNGEVYPLMRSVVKAISGRDPISNRRPKKTSKGNPKVVGSFGARKTQMEFTCSPYDTGLLESPYSCDRYYRCNDGVTHKFDCPPGLHFSVAASSCDWPENANCNQKAKSALKKKATRAPPTTPTPATESVQTGMWLLNPSPSQQENALPPMHSQLNKPSSWQEPIPTQPQAINPVQLNPGIPFMDTPTTPRPTQPPVNAFNNNQGPWGWALFGRNTASSYSDMKNNQNRGGDFCDNRTDGIYPSPTDCSGFIQCASRFTFRQHCGKGTVFNIMTKNCARTSNNNPACIVKN